MSAAPGIWPASKGAPDRMDALLSDLLAYARASGIPDEEVEPVDASRPLEAAIENLAGAIRESNARITVGEMPVVRMHASHLSQIFQNLISNAIKYRRADHLPAIDLTCESVDSQWVFQVQDNGIGIPEAYKEAIFGIFKRLHPNSKYSGTGMGLAICRRIVERYRGLIWVESEAGSGSRFFFSVPA